MMKVVFYVTVCLTLLCCTVLISESSSGQIKNPTSQQPDAPADNGTSGPDISLSPDKSQKSKDAASRSALIELTRQFAELLTDGEIKRETNCIKEQIAQREAERKMAKVEAILREVANEHSQAGAAKTAQKMLELKAELDELERLDSTAAGIYPDFETLSSGLRPNERRAAKVFHDVGMNVSIAKSNGKWLSRVTGVSGGFGFIGGAGGFTPSGSSVADHHLPYLEDFPAITHLGLENSLVTDHGLRCLRLVPHVESLSLEHTGISDNALDYVKSLKHLRELNIASTKITDAGLAKLSELKNLERISLPWRNVSDVGLMHLTVLPKLRVISFLGPRPPVGISDAGIALFKKAFPACELRF